MMPAVATAAPVSGNKVATEDILPVRFSLSHPAGVCSALGVRLKDEVQEERRCAATRLRSAVSIDE